MERKHEEENNMNDAEIIAEIGESSLSFAHDLVNLARKVASPMPETGSLACMYVADHNNLLKISLCQKARIEIYGNGYILGIERATRAPI